MFGTTRPTTSLSPADDEDPDRRSIPLLEPIPRSDVPSANGDDQNQPHPQHQRLGGLKQNKLLETGTNGNEERDGEGGRGEGEEEDEDDRARTMSDSLLGDFTGYTKSWRSPTRPRLSRGGSLSPINVSAHHEGVGKQARKTNPFFHIF